VATTPDRASWGECWPEDDGWLLVGERVPEPEDAVHDREAVCDSGFDVLSLSDAEVLALWGPVTPFEVAALASIDPRTLSRDARLAYLSRMEAVKSFVAAMDSRALVAIAGADGSDSAFDRQAAMEVAVTRRVGEGSASTSIATARALHVEFPAFRAALEAGEVSEWHCRILVSETAHVTDPGVTAALQDRLLPKAKRKTPGEFRRDVRKAVADLDAAKETERHELARAGRHVTCTPPPNGMGHLGIVSDWPTISAMHAVATRDGARHRCPVAARRPRGPATTTPMPTPAAPTRSPRACSARRPTTVR
jgi:hypothetical protein